LRFIEEEIQFQGSDANQSSIFGVHSTSLSDVECDQGYMRIAGKFCLLLDAVVIGAPVDDVLLDGFGFEALGDGFVDECGKLGVGGEAEGDDLLDIELLDVGEVGGWQERRETEMFFEADDAVLHFEVVDAGFRGEDDEGSGDDDPPEMKIAMMMPVMDGDGDGDDEIDKEDGKDEEVHGWIEAAVILEALGCGHN
jgi:hypothetical protein